MRVSIGKAVHRIWHKEIVVRLLRRHGREATCARFHSLEHGAGMGTRLAHVLKETMRHMPVARTKAERPVTGRVAPTPQMLQLFCCSESNCRKSFIKEAAILGHMHEGT
jgi:hypothetical protein